MQATVALLTLLVCLFSSGCANNQVSVWFENDSLSYGPPTDANYTQGLQLTVQPRERYDPCSRGARSSGDCMADGVFRKFVNWINFLEYDGRDTDNDYPIWLEYSFGQQFYTPDDLKPAIVQPLDRPYAGWLYGSLRINNDRTQAGDGAAQWLNDRRRTVALRLGVVGPASQASALQKWWHEEVCDCTYPNGWHLQVRNEPGFVLSAAQEDRVSYFEFGNKWRGDLFTRGELSLGNVYTGVDLSTTLRFGYNLPRSFSPLTISPQNLFVPAVAQRADVKKARLSVYGFAGIIGRGVARDIFLDGNSFRTSPHTVDREPFVAEGQIGVGLGYGKWSLRVLFAHRSDQYETQAQAHRFGSLVITYTPTW